MYQVASQNKNTLDVFKYLVQGLIVMLQKVLLYKTNLVFT